uniref:Uncharacterized protein n=1 Tax=Panagrolaimus superbus TaxID=310955 RepID=A0A914Z570_9BILA
MENYFWLSVDNVGEEFMALVNGKGEKVEIIVVSCKSKTINRQLSFTINNSKTFVEKIGFLFKDFFKAVILNLYDLDPRGYYPNNLEFCEAVREKFKAVKVPHFFLSAPLVILSTSLITAKIYAKNGEKILILQFSPTSDVIISELTLTKKGYQISDYREISADDLTANENDGIMNFNCNPKGIILCDAPSSMKQLLKNSILKNKKFFEFTKKDGQHVPEFLNEWTKWLMNKSFNKYFVIPYCMRNYDVSFSSNGTLHSLLNLNFGTNDYKEVLLQENCHQNKITLMVDDESFPTCKIEPIFLPSIQRLPQKLDGIVKNKFPVVGFFHHTSVICTAENDKSNYEFLEAWNGMFFGTLPHPWMKIHETLSLFND